MRTPNDQQAQATPGTAIRAGAHPADGHIAGAEVEVVESAQAGQHSVVVIRILAGGLRADMTLQAERTGDRWRVLSFGFVPVEAWQDGRRALALAPCGDAQPLQQGDRLTAKG